jgi:hypothetical protein
VIILIAGYYIKNHSSEHLFHISVWKIQTPHGFKDLLIRIRFVPVEMSHCTKRLNMKFFAGIGSVEPFCHKVSKVAFRQQATFGHPDTAIDSHFVICILNPADSGRVVFDFTPFYSISVSSSISMREESSRPAIFVAGSYSIAPIPLLPI